MADCARICDQVFCVDPDRGQAAVLQPVVEDPTRAIVAAPIEDACEADRKLKPGTLIVGQTSGAPNATRAMAAELTRQAAELIDAPVSCGVRGADAGTSRSWSEPPPRNTRAFSPSCRRSARTCSTSAKSSTGHTMKLVNNLLSCAQRLLTFEGTALAAKNGIAPGAAVEILTAVAEGMAT